jgi:hypothetical protein
MKPTLREVRERTAPHLAAIHQHFTADSKILVVVVFPDKPQQNWLLGNATIDEAIDALRYLAHEGEEAQERVLYVREDTP